MENEELNIVLIGKGISIDFKKNIQFQTIDPLDS
jgi:hypothetical protein